MCPLTAASSFESFLAGRNQRTPARAWDRAEDCILFHDWKDAVPVEQAVTLNDRFGKSPEYTERRRVTHQGKGTRWPFEFEKGKGPKRSISVSTGFGCAEIGSRLRPNTPPHHATSFYHWSLELLFKLAPLELDIITPSHQRGLASSSTSAATTSTFWQHFPSQGPNHCTPLCCIGRYIWP